MKKVISILFILFFLVIPSAQAYSGTERFVDDVKLAFSSGDDKVELALEVKEKEVDSAIENINAGDSEESYENIKNAQENWSWFRKECP